MKSLKITLLLAVFCVALMGVTYSNDAAEKKVQDIENYDINNPENKITNGKHKRTIKPPMA